MALKNIETAAANRRRFVLVVDSNDRNQRYLSTILNRFEYEAYAVKTAQEALEIASVISPVLIVTAAQLDDGNNARGLITAFKSAIPPCTAHFIVLTTRLDPLFERDCLNAGALVCLRAPVTFENFYRIIQVALEPIPRMSIRISTNLPAAISGKRKDEWVQGISENGAYIMTSLLHPHNAKVPVRIKLSNCVVSADAVVIYSKQSDSNGKGQSGLGLQFVRISEEDQQRIRLFIRSEMSKGVAPLRNPK